MADDIKVSYIHLAKLTAQVEFQPDSKKIKENKRQRDTIPNHYQKKRKEKKKCNSRTVYSKRQLPKKQAQTADVSSIRFPGRVYGKPTILRGVLKVDTRGSFETARAPPQGSVRTRVVSTRARGKDDNL